MTGRMLIAGVGNIFLGDDGFGVEVARRLADAGADLPDGVRVADYGISGLHLAYDLAEGYETTILIDASPRGGEPGTVYVMEADTGVGRAGARRRDPAQPGQASLTGESPLLDAHGMQPDVMFGMLDMLGASPGRVLVVGCEPASVDEGMGLSAPVAAAVDEAVRVVLDLARTAGTGGVTDGVLAGGDTASPGDTPDPDGPEFPGMPPPAATAGDRPARLARLRRPGRERRPGRPAPAGPATCPRGRTARGGRGPPMNRRRS